MEEIARQPYYKIVRQLSSIKQEDIKEMREITLYTDRITTRHREFSLDEVLDMSYRNFGKKGGLLYLHTLRGVFSYHVDESPEEFIRIFKQHIECN